MNHFPVAFLDVVFVVPVCCVLVPGARRRFPFVVCCVWVCDLFSCAITRSPEVWPLRLCHFLVALFGVFVLSPACRVFVPGVSRQFPLGARYFCVPSSIVSIAFSMSLYWFPDSSAWARYVSRTRRAELPSLPIVFLTLVGLRGNLCRYYCAASLRCFPCFSVNVGGRRVGFLSSTGISLCLWRSAWFHSCSGFRVGPLFLARVSVLTRYIASGSLRDCNLDAILSLRDCRRLSSEGIRHNFLFQCGVPCSMPIIRFVNASSSLEYSVMVPGFIGVMCIMNSVTGLTNVVYNLLFVLGENPFWFAPNEARSPSTFCTFLILFRVSSSSSPFALIVTPRYFSFGVRLNDFLAANSVVR